MEKINLFVDFDNTLVNTNAVCVSLLNRRYGTSFALEDLHKYDFGDLWPSLTYREIDRLFEEPELFEKISFLSGSESVLSGMKQHFNIHLVSCGTPENKRLKELWLSANFPHLTSATVLTDGWHDKSSVDMSGGIFIDDHISCLRSSNAAVKVMFKNFSYGDWNEYDNLDEIYIVNTWQEVKSILEFYVKIGGIV